MQPGKMKRKGNKKSFIPFFVTDRQASLRILSGIAIPDGKQFGLMTHANTHRNFGKVFKKFPCVNIDSCPIIGMKNARTMELLQNVVRV